MRSSHSPDQITVFFDDDHAVADAGLILAASLAEGLMLHELFDAHVATSARQPARPTLAIRP